MSSVAQPVATPLRRRREAPLSLGVTTGIPERDRPDPARSARAPLAWRAEQSAFWDAITDPQAVAALKLTFAISLVVVLINAVAGTVIAWVLVRDSFRGKSLVNALIDLPFALPTIVAGLTLLALYGPKSPIGVNVAYTTGALVLALLFVTLPFVVRTVQPVLLELDRDMEEAAHSLGATPLQTFRRVVFPNLFPAILSGTALGVRARARRVRRRRPDLREPAVQDRGRVRLHLRPDRERQRHRRGGRVGRPARRLARRSARDRRRAPLGHEA